MTNKAITFEDGKLKYLNLAAPKLQPKNVIISNKCLGVNYNDYNAIQGSDFIKINKHNILGFEGSGVIESVDKGCTKGYKVGDRVCYISFPGGAFMSKKSVPETNIFPLPRFASFEVGATLLKSLMAYTLLGKVFSIKKNATIILTGASGGVGSFFCQIAKKAGLNVIGLTRFDDKISYIKSNGAVEAFNYNSYNVVEAINHITNGAKADFFFDCLGADVQNFAFDVLKDRGFFISFGNITGMPQKINLQTQYAKSITVSSVSLNNFINTYENLTSSSLAIFKSIQFKILKPRITSYSFNDGSKAFLDLKNGSKVGQKILFYEEL
jgi:NADPH:quinone reductase